MQLHSGDCIAPLLYGSFPHRVKHHINAWSTHFEERFTFVHLFHLSSPLHAVGDKGFALKSKSPHFFTALNKSLSEMCVLVPNSSNNVNIKCCGSWFRLDGRKSWQLIRIVGKHWYQPPPPPVPFMRSLSDPAVTVENIKEKKVIAMKKKDEMFCEKWLRSEENATLHL